jgi:hypothetical protein
MAPTMTRRRGPPEPSTSCDCTRPTRSGWPISALERPVLKRAGKPTFRVLSRASSVGGGMALQRPGYKSRPALPLLTRTTTGIAAGRPHRPDENQHQNDQRGNRHRPQHPTSVALRIPLWGDAVEERPVGTRPGNPFREPDRLLGQPSCHEVGGTPSASRRIVRPPGQRTEPRGVRLADILAHHAPVALTNLLIEVSVESTG